AGSTRYWSVNGFIGPPTAEASSTMVAAQAFTITSMTIVRSAAPGSGKTSTVTLDDNLSPTSLSCSLTGTGSGAGITTNTCTGSVSVAAGDVLDISTTLSASGTIGQYRIGIVGNISSVAPPATVSSPSSIGSSLSMPPNNLGLVGWWTFDGAQMVSNVADSSGSGNNGNLVGATTTTPGPIGQALSFNGVNNKVTIGSVTANLQGVSFWMKAATSTTQQNIIDVDGAGTNVEIVSGTVTANGFTSPTIYVDGVVSSTVSDTAWHHIVVTTGTPINANSSVTLGSVGGTFFGGSLDDVRIYNRVLGAGEVKQLYNL
ncbi:MAG TPA: hypothetical protein VMV38_02135, partial [Candidatus Paceibacterota bacterium]|nr:hypothetical protein [Candidatus Paceibacterota bacterium]